jgi:RHS repeat-associated protein
MRDMSTDPSSNFVAVDVMTSDYYPFGMLMPGPYIAPDAYRYGYNGMEQDKEVKGNGKSYTTEFRQYDPRIGRWLSLDLLKEQFVWISPYNSNNNNPIFFADIDGDIPWPKIVPGYKGVGGLATQRKLKGNTRAHHGLDILANLGSEIHAAANGKVIFSEPMNGYGNVVAISHGNGFVTLYAHMKLSDIYVKKGDIVENNQLIANVGNEGRSFGPHLHVEFIKNPDASDKFVGFAEGVKNTRVYDPRSIIDLQNVIDGKENFKGKFLTSHNNESKMLKLMPEVTVIGRKSWIVINKLPLKQVANLNILQNSEKIEHRPKFENEKSGTFNSQK